MNYWRGYMNWPLAEYWKCETCGENEGLTWGLVHAQARCNVCHTEYRMRVDDGTITDKPVCRLKDEYKEPAKKGWTMYHIPISEWDDSKWDRAIAELA